MVDYLLTFLLIGFISVAVLFEQIPLINQFYVTGQVGDTQLFTLIFAVFSFSYLGAIQLKTGSFRFPIKVSFVFSLFLLWNIASLFTSKDMGVSIFQVLRVISYFVLFLSVYNLLRKNPKRERIFLIGFAFASALILIRDLLPYIISGDVLNGSQFRGSFFWHNQMAGFLLYLIPLLAGLIFYFRERLVKYTFFCLLLVSTLAMIFTYSRGGWIGLIITGMIFIFLLVKKYNKLNTSSMFSIFLLSVLAFGFTVFQIDSVRERALSIKDELFSDTRTSSGSLRLTVWRNGLRMTTDSPVLGVGAGAFGSAYYNYQTDPWLYARNAHNHYLEIAAEVGFIGLALFILLISLVFYLLYKNKGDFFGEKADVLLISIVSTLIASLVHAFVDVDWSRISLFSIFWIFLAVVAARLETKEIVIRLRGYAVLIFLPILILLSISGLLFVAERDYLQAQKDVVRGNLDKAEDHITKALTINPFESRYFFLEGSINEIKNEDKRAENSYKKALDINPLLSPAYTKLGFLSFKAGDVNSAEKFFSQAVKIAPFANPVQYGLLSDINKNLDNDKLAKNILEDAVLNKFTIGDVFEDIEHRYNVTGFKKDLAGIYLRLIEINLREENNVDAKNLLIVLEDKIDPENSEIPAIKQYLQII